MMSQYEPGGIAGTNPADAARRKALQDALDGPAAAIAAPAVTGPGVANAPDLSQFDRRGGSTGGFWKGAASGASAGALGGTIATGGAGTLFGAAGGALVGGIKGAIQKHASTAPTDFNVGDARTAIGQEYQHDLGRDASASEIDAQLAGQGLKPGDRYVGESGLNSVLGSIGQSPEAQQYASRSTQPTAQEATAPVAAPVASGQFRPGGYDDAKWNDPTHNSPKYAIGRALSNFDPRQGFTPEAIAALNALGIGQFSANNGRLNVANGSGAFNGMNSWDGIKGMHSDHPEWQFGVDSNLDAQAPPQTAQGGPGGPVSLTTPGLSPALGGDPQARIRAELDALINGSQSPALRQALMGRMA